MQESQFEGIAGYKIFFRSWRPDTKPRAVVVLVHGFNSHSGYYVWTAEQLVQQGFAVYALDHRGRGRSDGERFYVEKFADYENDLDTFVKLAKTHEPGLPVFMLGHSAGGVISTCYCLDHAAEVAGLICESFAFQVPAPDFVLAAVKGLSHLAPHAHVLKLNNAEFSRDPKVVEGMNNDPLIAHEVQPTQTVAEMARADERLKASFPQFKVPVLIIHGTADKVTRPSGSREFYERAGSSDKTLKLYEDYFHDPLNDVGKERVLADIVAWLNARLPA